LVIKTQDGVQTILLTTQNTHKDDHGRDNAKQQSNINYILLIGSLKQPGFFFYFYPVIIGEFDKKLFIV
jgi:hypothetical protein